MKRILFSVVLTVMACCAVHAQDTLHQYVGKYTFPDGSVVPGVEVLFDNGALTMNSTAGTSPLQLLGPDSFNIVNFSGYAVFRRNDHKKIAVVHIEASGYVLEGPKDSTTGLTRSFGFSPEAASKAIAGSQHVVQQFFYHPVISKEGKKDEYDGGR